MVNINYKIFFSFILYLCTLILIYNIPKESDYYYRADEGTYYRQAKSIKEHGLSQISFLTEAYISNNNFEQIAPHPLRVGHLLFAIIAITIHDSISSLSYLSIFFYVIFTFINFLFFRKWYSDLHAFIIGTFLCFSPLLCGLSERALADVDYSFFQILSIYLLIDYLKSQSNKHFYRLLSCLTITLLFKEASLIFFPFFLITLLYFRFNKNNPQINNTKLLALILIPILSASFIIVSIIGIERSFHFIQQFIKALNTPDKYLTDFQSGPWYVYLLDLFILSPYISILSLLYAGYYVFVSKKEVVSSIFFFFFIYFLICFTIFPKDIRFGLPIDTVTRIFAGLFVVKIYQENGMKTKYKKILLVGTIVVFSLIDLGSYYNFFITNKIYDPSSYYLLKVKRIIP